MSRHDPVVALRHMLGHANDRIDLDVLWRLAAHDLAPLIESLHRAIAQEGPP